MEIYKKSEIEKIGKLFLNEKIIAFPTETVFGLGVISSSKKAFDKLVEVKKRSPNKPFTMMISSLKQVENLLIIDELSKRIIEKFMPGELTLILKAKDNVPSYLDLNSGYIGIRMPKDDFILKLIDLINTPLLVPSANPKDLTPAKSVEEVINYFEGKIDGVIEGKSLSNIPSTVIKVDNNHIDLIREGTLKLEYILKEIKL